MAEILKAAGNLREETVPSEWSVRLVMKMYECARTSVRGNGELCEEFPLNVGLHKLSVLSPLLSIIVLEALSRGFRSVLS